MMATTHGLWGMALAIPVLAASPELAPAAFAAGLVGGLAPDFDLYTGHRKTLHYPVYASAAAVPALALALLAPSPWTVALGVGLAAAAVHAVCDVFGGGLELRPWEGTSDRAVYSHYHDRWIRPRRWVRYDGGVEDFLLAGLATAVLVAAGDGFVTTAALALFLVSAAYSVVRKPLASVAERLAELVPPSLSPYVPARYRPQAESRPPDTVR